MVANKTGGYKPNGRLSDLPAFLSSGSRDLGKPLLRAGEAAMRRGNSTPVTLEVPILRGICFWPLVCAQASLKGSQLWAPVFNVVVTALNWLCKDSEMGAHTRGP